MIYLDYSANTPADAAVLRAFAETEQACPGNPNSNHPAGLAARNVLAAATDSIAQQLRVLPSKLIYTSGASEANNLAIKGAARVQRHADAFSDPGAGDGAGACAPGHPGKGCVCQGAERPAPGGVSGIETDIRNLHQKRTAGGNVYLYFGRLYDTMTEMEKRSFFFRGV